MSTQRATSTSSLLTAKQDAFARVEELMATGVSYADAKAQALAEALPDGIEIVSIGLADEATHVSHSETGAELRRKHRRTRAPQLDPELEVTEEAFRVMCDQELAIVLEQKKADRKLPADMELDEYKRTLKRMIVFLRVSVDRHNASKSPMRQAREFATWLAVWGYTAIEVHVERGVSGMAPYDNAEARPVFEALMHRIEAGEFGTKNGAKTDVSIGVESFSRWSRSKVLCAMAAEKMEHYGFFLHQAVRADVAPYQSYTENANALVQAGIANDLAWRAIQATANAHQRYLLTTGQLLADYSQGYCHENEVGVEITSKGRKLVTKMVRLVPSEKPVGEEIIRRVLNKERRRAIVRDFRRRRILTRAQYDVDTETFTEGNEWTISSMTRWLRRPALCAYQFDPKGDPTNRDDYYPTGKIEPLCDFETWWTIQTIMNEQRESTPGHGNSHRKHRGSRVLGCALCTGDLFVTGRYYACSWRHKGDSAAHPGEPLPFPDLPHATMGIDPTNRMLDEATIAVIEALPSDMLVQGTQPVNPSSELDELQRGLLQIEGERRTASVKLDAHLISEVQAKRIGAELSEREQSLRERIVAAIAAPAHPLEKVLEKISDPASIRAWWYDPQTDEEDQGDVIAAVWAHVWVDAGVKHTHTMDIERRMRFVAKEGIVVPESLIDEVRERVIAERIAREGSAGRTRKVEVSDELGDVILSWNYEEGISATKIGARMNADPKTYPPLSGAGWYPNLIRRVLDAAYLRHPEIERPSSTRLTPKAICDLIDKLVPQIGYEATAVALNATKHKRPKNPEQPWDYAAVYAIYHGGKKGSGANRKMPDDLVTLAQGLSKANKSLEEIRLYILETTGVSVTRSLISKRLTERKHHEARTLLAARKAVTSKTRPKRERVAV